jgi:cytochrome c oxidase subunit II
MDVLVVFALMAAIWTGLCVWIAAGAKKATASFDSVYARVGSYRRFVLVVLVSITAIIFIFTLFTLPYPAQRAEALGAPTTVVNVVGLQWSWTMSTRQVPLSGPVEFNVTSKDVVHDFAVYNSQGVLLGQMEVLPGYSNQLILTFDQPGTYTVRCLDYCGVGHAFMTTTFTVS